MTWPAEIPELNVYRGDDQALATFTLYDDVGEPLDLSASTITAQWRQRPDDARSIALTVDTTTAATGQLELSVTAATSAALSDGYWDLQGVIGGIVTTYLFGRMKVRKDITRG